MGRPTTKEEALEFLSVVFRGRHHIPNGASSIQEYGWGWYIWYRGDLATYDFDTLTRLVFAAHTYCFRVSVSSHCFHGVKIAVWKRTETPKGVRFIDQGISERHPTLDDAVERWKSS